MNKKVKNMKQRVLISVIIVVFIGFVGYSSLQPYSIISSGYKEMVEGSQNQAAYYFNIENDSRLPANLQDFDIVGYSDMTLMDKNIDTNNNSIRLTCEAKMLSNMSSAPSKLRLSYSLFIFKFTQTIEL
jgi:hypothetical protein